PTRLPEERQRQQGLLAKRGRLDAERDALLRRSGSFDQIREPLQELVRRRSSVQEELSRLDAEWSRREGFDLARIQAQLPAHPALVGWVAVRTRHHGVDPDGEHWACVVRKGGPPAWVRLPGSGVKEAWTVDDEALPGRVREALASL